MTAECGNSGAAAAATTAELERRERESRSLALEKAYVHDVYDQLSHHFSEERYRPWPRVRHFLEQLEPGSLVCDAGCGNGKYLQVNTSVFKIGSDRCGASVEAARRKDHEVLICDALNLPYRDESFDAALSIAVIHHLATRDRRVRALKELARILRVGGRILITVWAKEQRHRKFESQDILVPWRTPDRSSSEEKPEGAANEHESLTTTTTSDEDVTHYHAYTQTSESDSCYSYHKKQEISCDCRLQPGSQCADCSGCLMPSNPASGVDEQVLTSRRRHHRAHHHKGRSFDPHRPSCSSQSSSDLSSPSDSCYSFVRKALQKLASTRRAVGSGHRRSWFTVGESVEHPRGAWSCAALEAVDPSIELPIELRHLDSEEDGGGLGSIVAATTPANERISRSSPPSLGGGSTLFCGCETVGEPQAEVSSCGGGCSSSSVSPILPRRSSSSSLAAGMMMLTTSAVSSSSAGTQPAQQSHGNRSLSLSDLLHSLPISVSSWLKHRLSEEDAGSSLISPGSEECRPMAPSPRQDDTPPPPPAEERRSRPVLTKQKRALQLFESYCEEEDDIPVALTLSIPTPSVVQQPARRVLKQGSLNDSLLSSERLKEREKLKRSLMPRQVTWSGVPSSPSGSIDLTEPIPLVPIEPVTSPVATKPSPQPPPPPVKSMATKVAPPPPPPPSDQLGEALKDFTSLRNGFVRIWQTIRGDSSSSKTLLLDERQPSSSSSNKPPPWLLDSPTDEATSSMARPSLPPPQRRPPSLLEKRIKSFCGWGIAEESVVGPMSPSPRRLPPVANCEEDFFNFSLPRCCADQDLTGFQMRSAHPHRLSSQHREDGSDSSSKDSSLQSDTSVDSEDSCVSVIFIPHPEQAKNNEAVGDPATIANPVAKTRNSSSSSSDGSPKVKVFPSLILPTSTTTATTEMKTELLGHSSTQASSKNPSTTPLTMQEAGPTTDDKLKAVSPPPSSLNTRQSCLSSPDALVAAGRSCADKERSVAPLYPHHHRLLSFEVFNPETDDLDSDSDCDDGGSTSESSSSNSAGSVISVGDPMWPAFQDRRQTILSGSSLDFQTSASIDLASSEQADNSLIKQDSSDSWPASIEDPSAVLTSQSSQTSSRTNQTSPASLIAAGTLDSHESKSSSSPSLGDSSSAGSSVKQPHNLPLHQQQQQLQQQQQQQESHSDVEEWRVRSSLGPLDECYEEEGNELCDAFQYDKTFQQQHYQTSAMGQQWKLDKVKSSFSASTSSLDSSISAPSFSSTRQSSSASAVSTTSEMRKNSDDSAVISTLPLLRSRARAASAGGSTAAAFQIPSNAASSVGHQSVGKRLSCEDELCFAHHSKPLNKMLLGSSGDERQRSTDQDSSLSISTSQDSLPSDAGGSHTGGGGHSGTVTLHRYYHVFRQGELDQLIERYVENLHIISSYYDHANHCVVAEKVHVWTI